MSQSDGLRINMIKLALENGGFDVLDELHAREIPSLYLAHSLGPVKLDFKKSYDKEMITAVAANIDKVWKYFSEEFEIASNGLGKQRFSFTYPFLGRLLDMVIKNNSKAAPKMLKNALQHNKNVLKMLEKTAKLSASGFKNGDYAKVYDAEYIENCVMNYYSYNKDDDTVGLYPRCADVPNSKGFFSNIIRIQASSKDEYVQSLIEDVNKSYSDAAQYRYKEE